MDLRAARAAFALVVLAAVVIAAAGAGRAHDAVRAEPGRVNDDVYAALASAERVPVIVSLRSQPLPAAAQGADIALRKSDVSARQARVLAAVPAWDFEVRRRFEALPAVAGIATAAGVAALTAHPDVERVSLDAQVQGALAESVPLVRADDVHALGVTGAGVTVAVLDTGIDTDHPEMADDIAYQRCFLFGGPCPTIAGVAAGCGGSGPNSGFLAEDGSSHGSHVSGIVTKNGPVNPGIAPDAQIKAFKVLNDCGSGFGSFSDMESAIDEIVALRATTHADVDIINMSIVDNGSHAPGTCDGIIPSLTSAINDARTLGIITFISSGNGGHKSGLSYPSCIANAVSVGATYDAVLGPLFFTACVENHPVTGEVACWSQSDSSLDLLAPGSAIDSTVPFGSTTKSGTSMASPTAAGVAALLLDDEPLLTPAQVETRLRETGKPIVDGFNNVIDCRVDAYEAVVNDGGPVCPVSDTDGVAAPPDNCPAHNNPLQENNDAGGGGWAWIADGTGEATSTGGNACDPNDDNAGCRDAIEPLLTPARDPLDPWDYAAMWSPALPASGPASGSRDGSITISDVLATLPWVGTVDNGAPNASGRDYDSDVNANGVQDGVEYDRSPTATPALSGPPSGAVAIADVLVVLAQVGQVC